MKETICKEINKIKVRSRAILLMTAFIILYPNLYAQQSAPTEILSQKLTRTAQSPQTQSLQLSQNLFRSESYQAEYTVQIPYQVNETYVEQIPYTVSVPYTDYVTEYRSEYQCQQVTRYRSEQRCRTVHDVRRDCHNETQCHIVPGAPGQCHDVEECGINVQGNRICKTRRVCDQPGEPAKECTKVPVCQNIPVTNQVCENVNIPYQDQDCGYVQVPYQTPVTKYREETRYKEETKTRVVTKYRNEVRCCKQAIRQVFDRQINYEVIVQWPNHSELVGTEKELIEIQLIKSTENTAASVQVLLNQTLNLYKVKSVVSNGAIIQVELDLIVNEELIQELQSSQLVEVSAISTSAKNAAIQLVDRTLDIPQIQTNYTIQLSEILPNGNVLTLTTPQKVSRAQAAAVKNQVALSRLLGKNVSVLKAGKIIQVQVLVERMITRSSVGQPTAVRLLKSINITK